MLKGKGVSLVLYLGFLILVSLGLAIDWISQLEASEMTQALVFLVLVGGAMVGVSKMRNRGGNAGGRW